MDSSRTGTTGATGALSVKQLVPLDAQSCAPDTGDKFHEEGRMGRSSRAMARVPVMSSTCSTILQDEQRLLRATGWKMVRMVVVRASSMKLHNSIISVVFLVMISSFILTGLMNVCKAVVEFDGRWEMEEGREIMASTGEERGFIYQAAKDVRCKDNPLFCGHCR